MSEDLGFPCTSNVEDLQTSPASMETRAEALEIIRSLIDQIVLHPVENGFDIEPVGEIANMVMLANGDCRGSSLNPSATGHRGEQAANGVRDYFGSFCASPISLAPLCSDFATVR